MSESSKPRLLVAMSGGVDSAVAALRLREQGFPIEAAYMKNWINEEEVLGHCPWQQDIDDASAVCGFLGIPFRVINFMRDYRERVVRYLVDGYARGITPNPDVMCNREMKFGVLLDWARENSFDGVATGHYAIRRADRLFQGTDPEKDQSYFLAMLTPEQRDRAWFPVGELHKSEVRRIASAARLPNAGKKDSQGICFIGEVKINDFLEKFIPDKPGVIVDGNGKILGEHRGLHRYTIGQRRGIGVPSNTDNEFYVVIGKDLAKNQLIVAFESSRPEAIWTLKSTLINLSWLSPNPPQDGEEIQVKVRYRDPDIPAKLRFINDLCVELDFSEPQRALASGQICALYRNRELLGGGVFQVGNTG